MSASCQSKNSMFKVRPIRTCAKFEPVKESEAQIPSVELITELVKVELQELCFYVMVRVQYAPFGIADGNVHPRQNFPDTLFVIRNYGMVGGCHSVLFKSGITAEPVRGHIGVSVRPRLYLARDGGSLKIADDQHLYMPDSFGRTVLSGRRRSGPAAFGHDKDGSLALASTPSLQRTVLLVFRSFGGKEALVHFHIPMKGVKAVAPAHHIAQLMHHFPYGLVTLAAELALYLLCRYGTPGSRQQEHGRKPITHRKMAALHDRARTKLHLMFAIHASPGLMARIPAQAQTAALAAEQTVVFTETTQCSLAGGLVWVLTVKIKQGHIIYVFIVHTSRIKHKVFQYTPIAHLGGLNFANLGTCGHSFNDIKSNLQRLTRNDCYSIKCQAFIGYLHYLTSDRPYNINNSRQPHTVDEDFANRIYKIENPIEALGIWIALNQHWVLDSDYSFIRKNETHYDRFLKDGLRKSIQAYYTYSNTNNDEELKLWEKYETTKHYLLLLYRIALFEKTKNQKSNLFLELWNNNCFIRYRADIYESFGVGLLTELSGKIDTAEEIFKAILEDNPINRDAIEMLAEFKKRNNIE